MTENDLLIYVVLVCNAGVKKNGGYATDQLTLAGSPPDLVASFVAGAYFLPDLGSPAYPSAFQSILPFDEHTRRKLCAADRGVVLIFLKQVSNAMRKL